jgi:outer membrane protein, heavy metal efflux system
VSRWVASWFATLAVLLTARVVQAAPPLELREVLETLEGTHPELEVAETRVEAAKARHDGARGFFDPRFGFSTRYAPVGYREYYPQFETDAVVRQATPLWGTRLYAGHRLGLGDYPLYRRGLKTLSAGELRAGIGIPLLRGGAIDEGRAAIAQTRARAQGAADGRDAQQLGVERLAARAYWNWVAAGMRLGVARRLLETATRRADQLQAQADAGAVAEIMVLDNERLVLEREARVVAAEQEFQAAALALSLYHRDEQLEPIVSGEDRLPREMPLAGRPQRDELDREIAEALRRRPDLRELEAEHEARAVSVRLAKNQVLPAVDLHGFLSKDFGSGPEDLRPLEAGFGVSIEVALPMRQARGELRAARAELRAIEARRRAVGDAVAAEIRKAHLAWEAAHRQAELAGRQQSVAHTLAEAEMERFREGASDLVVVNLRELAAADAEILEIEARAEVHRVYADFLAVTARGLLVGSVSP